MSHVQVAAAELLELLERENGALLHFDLPTATALLEAKRAALTAFESAGRATGNMVDLDATMRALARRLRDAAAENKRLLERAMATQQHILSLLAHAARQSRPCGHYGAKGGYVGRPAESAFALSARA